MQNKNKKIIGGAIWDSQAPVGYSSFQIGCVIVEYGKFNITTLMRNPEKGTKSDIYVLV